MQDKPPVDCFDLKIREIYYGRNKSEIGNFILYVM
jgi:hypothetical protein